MRLFEVEYAGQSLRTTKEVCVQPAVLARKFLYTAKVLNYVGR